MIYFFVSVIAQRSPTISYITQTQIKDIGGTVELSCSVQYSQDYSVIWMKVDKSQNADSLPISSGSSLILHDSRFSLRYDPVSLFLKFVLESYSIVCNNFVPLDFPNLINQNHN